VVGKRNGPPQPLQASPLLPRNLREHRRPGEVRAIWPGPLHQGRLGVLHQEIRGDLGVAPIVHVPPSLAPDRRQPSHRLGSPVSSTSSASAKLDFPLPLGPTTTVSPEPGLQAQGRGPPDPPKAADHERPQVGTR
jgi:hypothetical protein